VLLVVGGVLALPQLLGNEDVPPQPPLRAAPTWSGQYQETENLCELVDPTAFSAIAHQRRGGERSPEEPKHVYDSTKLECTAMLFNTGANAGEADNARNLKLDVTAYVKQGNEQTPHAALYDEKVAELEESTPDLLTANKAPMDTRSSEVQGLGDRAFYTFAAGRQPLNLAYEGVYTVTVLHGNLILRVDAYVLREDEPWTMEELNLATHDVAIGIMEGLRAAP
jgi:hypothetical protein